MQTLILNKLVKIVCQRWDKYGRLLADIYFQSESKEEIHLNSFMVKNKLAVSYQGKTKTEFQPIMDEKTIDNLPSSVDYPM